MTRRSIKQFMWGYQEHFRLAVERLAKESLGVLAPRLTMRALLVGVRATGAKTYHEVCVEPEDGDVPQDLFKDLEVRIQALMAEDPLNEVWYGDKPSNDDKPRWIREGSVKRAVAERLSQFDGSNGTRSFCGKPVTVGSFEVVPILQVDALAFEALPHLTRTDTWHDKFQIVPSLPHAVVECLLAEAHDGLYKPDAGRSGSRGAFGLDGAGVLQRAAKSFSYTPSWAGGRSDLLGEIFELCCRIAAQRYESRGVQARMLIASLDHPAVERLVEFRRRVPLRATRWARKVLQMASEQLVVLCDGEALCGLGRLRSDYDPTREDAFIVDFRGQGAWDLLHGETILMRVLHEVPSLPSPRIGRDHFVSNLRRVVKETDETGARQVWDVVASAIEQRHGTMVVVSPSAEEEAERLAGQATAIKPTTLSRALVESVSEIDGALLLDPSGRCHAVGVILDGRAVSGGSSARGARFNSAVRYVEAAPSGTLAVVVSEDGDIDLIPNLRPQIQEKEVKTALESVASLRAKPDSDGIRNIMRRLDAYRFYLSGRQCSTVNEAQEEFSRFIMLSREVWIDYKRFEPDPKMNDSYFLLEEPSTQA